MQFGCPAEEFGKWKTEQVENNEAAKGNENEESGARYIKWSYGHLANATKNTFSNNFILKLFIRSKIKIQ